MSTPSYEELLREEARARAYEKVADAMAAFRTEMSDALGLMPREDGWECGAIQAMYMMIASQYDDWEIRADLSKSVAESKRRERVADRDCRAHDLLDEAGWAWQDGAWRHGRHEASHMRFALFRMVAERPGVTRPWTQETVEEARQLVREYDIEEPLVEVTEP